MCPNAQHRRHKGLNDRVENAHQPTRRREKSMVKMKSVTSAQTILSLMGTLRNSFSIDAHQVPVLAAFSVLFLPLFQNKKIWPLRPNLPKLEMELVEKRLAKKGGLTWNHASMRADPV